MAAQIQQESYRARTWPALHGLKGISDHTLEIHFGLYEGYVKNTNLLNEQLSEIVRAGEARGANLQYAELTRRLGFEYNGMKLHEEYFDNLTASANGRPSAGRLHEALGTSFGDPDTWQKAFSAVGGMRGVGWAIAYQDLTTGRITNAWVSLHQDGTLAGAVPILVMDVWEHAFMFDYKPAERGKYIEAFFSNVDWAKVEQRMKGPAARG